MAYIFKTTTTVPSKICEGVTVTVRKMTEDRRDALRTAMAAPLVKLQLIDQEVNEKKDRTDSDSRARVNELLNDALRIQTSELNAIKIDWGVKAISGLCIDDEGNVATVAEWKKWPSDLVNEVVGIVDRASGLAPAEVGELGPDTTLGAAEPSAKNDSIASSANETDGSLSATAAPSTPTL
jgi:hypothetical protein